MWLKEFEDVDKIKIQVRGFQAIRISKHILNTKIHFSNIFETVDIETANQSINRLNNRRWIT